MAHVEGRRHRQQHNTCSNINQQQDLLRRHPLEEPFLCEAVYSPYECADDKQRDAASEDRSLNQFRETQVEEKKKTNEEQRKARPLQTREVFFEDNEPAKQKKHRPELNDSLRDRRGSIGDRFDIENVVS